MRIDFVRDKHDEEFDDIEGMDFLRYAMTVAVAGRHSIIAWGRPGCGNTLMMSQLPRIMPRLLPDEAETARQISSEAALPVTGTARPFRMPHQTASIGGIFGGGVNLRPGEVSLAHNGVLFLDEAEEFRTSVLQMLRVPLESGQIVLGRAGTVRTYPARFQLAMTVMPCPCGNLGNPDKQCLCGTATVRQYWRKLSAPLLEKIAVRIDCDRMSEMDLQGNMSLSSMRRMVRTAWEAQYDRQGMLNQDMTADSFRETMRLHSGLFPEHSTRREKEETVKVARTIADMEGRADVSEDDVRTACSLHGKIPADID